MILIVPVFTSPCPMHIYGAAQTDVFIIVLVDVTALNSARPSTGTILTRDYTIMNIFFQV